MAKIVEEVVVIKFSKIVKDDSAATVEVTEEVRAALEQVAQELVDSSVIVEVMQVE